MSQSINPFGFIYQETDISSAHLFGFIPTPFPPLRPPKLPFFVPCSGWSPFRGDRACLVGFRGENAACLLLGTSPVPHRHIPPVKTAVITLAQLAALPTHAKHTLYTENPGGAVGSQHTELLFSPQTAPKSSANKLALHCEHK